MATLFTRGVDASCRAIVPTGRLPFGKGIRVSLLYSIRKASSTAPPLLSSLHNRLSALNKPPTFKYQPSPPDQDAVRALDSASCDPWRIWETSVHSGKATVATATLCISAYLRTFEGLTQGEIKKRVEVEKPGKRLLLWLWSAGNVDEKMYHKRLRDFLQSHAFKYELCYLLIEENEEEYLWSWLETDAGDLDKESVMQAPYLWRGYIVRKIVEAKMDQAITYGTNSADEAIEAFWRAVRLKKARQHDLPFLKRTSLTPSIVLLTARMSTPRFQETTTNNWTGIRTFLSSAQSSSPFVGSFDMNQLSCARLDLWKPGRPDASLALEIIEAFASGAEAPGIQVMGESRRFFLTFLGTVMEVLSKQGNVAKSAEIRDLRARLRIEWNDKFSRSPKQGVMISGKTTFRSLNSPKQP